MNIRHLLFPGLVLAVALCPARAQIFVANQSANTIGEYNLDGSVVNAALVSGLHAPTGLAVSGSNLFVTNESTGTIGEYNLDGSVVNATLVTGLSVPFGVAVSGSSLFVANLGDATIREYDAVSGALRNAALISGVAGGMRDLVVSGTNLFVMNVNGGTNGAGTISEYTTSGAVVSAPLVSGLTTPWGLVVSGSNLFVTGTANSRLGEYDAVTGATINAALTILGQASPASIALSGSNLFVAGGGKIGEYNLDGSAVNTALVSGLGGPLGLVIVAVPEPSACAALAGLSALGLAMGRQQRRRLSA